MARSVRRSLMILIVMGIFTFTILFGFPFLKKKYGVPEDVLERIKQASIEIKQKQNEQLTVGSAANIPDHVIKLWMKRGEEGRLEKFILEIFQIKDQRLLLLTIPETTRVTMSNELYQQMQAEESFLPQMLTLQTISDHFSPGKAEKFAASLIEEFLDIHLDSYAAVTASWIDSFLTPIQDGAEEFYQLSDSMKDKMKEPVTIRKTKQQIEQMYADLGCFFSQEIESVIPYLEAYEALKPTDVSAQLLPGEHTNSAYLPEIIKAKQKIYEYQISEKVGQK